MRVNARLDEETEEKLRFLEARTGASRSDVLRAALGLYYDRIRAAEHDPGQALWSAGFVGCADGPEDLSSTYKARLSERWGDKHGDR